MIKADSGSMCMSVSVGNYTRFTGVLVRRKYWQSHKSFQLVFKTAGGLRLSITGNPRLVKSLTVGETYKVEGTEVQLGKKSFIKDPIATLVVPSVSFFRRNIWAISIVSTLVFATGTASAYSIATQDHAEQPAVTTETEETTDASVESVTTETVPQTAPVAEEAVNEPQNTRQATSRASNRTITPTNSQQAVTPTPVPQVPAAGVPQEAPPAVTTPPEEPEDTPQVNTPDGSLTDPYSTDTPSPAL